MPRVIADKYDTSQHEQQRLERDKLSLEQRKLRLEGWKLFVEALVLITVSSTLVVAYGQWRAMYSNELTRDSLRLNMENLHQMSVQNETARRQFDLSMNQTIYTQAARVTFHAPLVMQPNGITKLYTTVFNDGHETASSVRFIIKISQKTIAQEQLIDTPETLTITVPYGLTPAQDRTGTDPFWLDTHRYSGGHTLRISEKTSGLVKSADVTVELKGTLTYGDGFRDRTDQFCLRYIHYTNSRADSPASDLVPCRDFRSALASALQTKRGYKNR